MNCCLKENMKMKRDKGREAITGIFKIEIPCFRRISNCISMKILIVSILFVVSTLPSAAQSEVDAVLKEIEQNNSTLSALREQMEARKIGNRTEIFLHDPEVEFNYLWGYPSAIGSRTDVAVSQSFDFPTAYGHRRNIADLKNVNAELAYKSERINLLLSAKRTCIDLVYYNGLIKEFSQRLDNAHKIAETYKIRLDQGDANILEYNKARLNLASMQAELTSIEAERVLLQAELRRMNNGKDIEFPAYEFSYVALPTDFEEWYSGMESINSILQYVRGEVEIGKEQVKLSRALSLPKFATGYMSEKVVGEHFQGVMFGVSIPLWENKNKQKYAEAQVEASLLVLEDSKVQFYNRLRSLYLKASVMQQNIAQYRREIEASRNDLLLQKALDSGEISLLSYLLEIGYYYDALVKALENEREYQLVLAELNAVAL